MSKKFSDSLSLYEPHLQNDSLSIISIPLELGSDARGLAAAPQYLLKNGLERMLTSLGCSSITEEVISTPSAAPGVVVGKAKHITEIVEVARHSAAAVVQSLKQGSLPVALGGDHSIAHGTIAGAASAEESLGVIWIDAHPDAHTLETTLSGNVHGMPAAARMGFGDPRLTEIAVGKHIAPENFLYIGLKDFDQAEIDFIRAHNVPAITMFDITRRGLSAATSAIDALSERVGKVWVSMDLDSIDAAFAPGVAMPNQGGLTKREVLNLARYIGRTCSLAGLDIVEMLPEKDVEGKTAHLALELIAQFLGADFSWYQDYMQQYEAERQATLKVAE